MRYKVMVLAALVTWVASPAVAQQKPWENLQPEQKFPQEVLEQWKSQTPAPATVQPTATPQEESLMIKLPSSLVKTQEDITKLEDFLRAVSLIEKAYHREVSGKELFELFTKSLEKLDPHMAVLSADDVKTFHESLSGKFAGIGAEISKSMDSEKSGIVALPLPDRPAAKAGLIAKDIIVTIDKKSTADMTLFEATNLLKGPADSKVDVTVWRDSEKKLLDFTIVRAEIKIPLVASAELKQGYGKVRLMAFGEDASGQVRAAITKLKKENNGPLKGLAIDLSNNPGGLLDEAALMLRKFLGDSYADDKAAIIISTESRERITPIITARGGEDILDGAPLVVLVNGGSASASEIFSGVCQLHGRCTVAGPEKSFGKGTVQTEMPLPSGGAFKMTTSQYLIGSSGCERPVQSLGITPDIMLKAPDGKLITEREASFANALKTSGVSTANCNYTFSVPAGHKAAAHEILNTFGYQAIDPPKTN